MDEKKLSFEDAYKQLTELVKKWKRANCRWPIRLPRTNKELN